MRGGRWGVALLAAGCDPSFRQVSGPPTGPDLTGGSGAGAGWHCDRRELDGRCIEYLGAGWDAASRDSDCGSPTLPGPCPSSDLGGCTLATGTPLVRTEWYYKGVYYSSADAPFLEGSCEANIGEWQDP